MSGEKGIRKQERVNVLILIILEVLYENSNVIAAFQEYEVLILIILEVLYESDFLNTVTVEEVVLILIILEVLYETVLGFLGCMIGGLNPYYTGSTL